MERVILSSCVNYRRDEVCSAVDRIIELSGGIDAIAHEGEKIFLKINLLMKKSPEEATTTHPLVVEAVAKRLVEHGCRVIIGDSPGGPYSEKALKSLYKVCGIEEAAEKSGAELNYDCSSEDYKTAENCIIKSFRLLKPAMECDRIIAIGKLKTHGMALYTGAVKLHFGMIPGLIKAEYHFKMPDIKDFSNMLVDICETVKPSYTFMDAVYGMEGAGPSAGTPVNTGLIMGAVNPYAMDIAGACLMGIKPSEVPSIARAAERKIAGDSLKDIEIVGTDIERFVKKYKIPDIKSAGFLSGRVPKGLEKFVNHYLTPRPQFNHSQCVGCGDCEEACPPKAINMVNKRPEVNLDKCIRCFCCQELCPRKAVEIKRSWVLRTFFK